jgi:hypothetical protein
MYCTDDYYNLRGLTLRAMGTQLASSRMSEPEQIARLQLVLPLDEFKAIEDFRFQYRMPNRSAAVRELLRRGLAVTNKRPPKNERG